MLSYEWFLPGRVYIIHIDYVITPTILTTMSQDVLDMLSLPHRTEPVHLIYNAMTVHLKSETKIPDIQAWTANVYRHPLTASVVTVIGLNRFNEHIARSMNATFASSKSWGSTAHTLNDALRLVQTFDKSLPYVNI